MGEPAPPPHPPHAHTHTHTHTAPGERYEVMLDFSNLTAGDVLYIANLNSTYLDHSGNSPFFCYSHLIMKFIVQVGAWLPHT